MRDSEERPPIVKLNDMRSNALDVQCWLGLALDVMHLDHSNLPVALSLC